MDERNNKSEKWQFLEVNKHLGIKFYNISNKQTIFYFCLQMRLSVQFHGQIIFSLTCNANHLKFFFKEKVFSFFTDCQSMHYCAKTNSFSRILKTIIRCQSKVISLDKSFYIKSIFNKINLNCDTLISNSMFYSNFKGI